MVSDDLKPIALDFYAGLGGWAEGFLAENYTVIGFDIERHDYGNGTYPGHLVLQDVLTITGAQFKPILDRLRVIVASPPCQKYSYMAMPWSKAKKLRAWYLESPERVAELNALFNACFRIQKELSQLAGRKIPLIVENVRGAQEWVGSAGWHHGSYFLWGDLPALMPVTFGRAVMKAGVTHRSDGSTNFHGAKSNGQDWSRFARTGEVSKHWRMEAAKQSMGGSWYGDYEQHKQRAEEHIKQGGDWFGKNCQTSMSRMYSSKSKKRKAASAMIAKIPFPLANYLAKHFKQCYLPEYESERNSSRREIQSLDGGI